MCFRILFINKEPLLEQHISQSIDDFPSSYSRAIQEIVQATANQTINQNFFVVNTIKILSSFKMTRQGVFKGLGMDIDGNPIGPVSKIEDCWNAIGTELIEIRNLLNNWCLYDRDRLLVLMDDNRLRIISDRLYRAFKKILPITMSKHSYGLVGASKILFAIFPEIVLPVDNIEWKILFQTVDLGDVIRLMANEIKAWELATGLKLNECNHLHASIPLPVVYNVMAMKARP
jgi:hypothetical protein